MQTATVAPTAALALALVLTPAARWLAQKVGMVAQPRPDRWHSRPTALLGGVAIFIAVNGALLLSGLAAAAPAILAASTLLFGLGLYDDFRPLTPYQKLAAQIIPAAIIVHFGFLLEWTRFEPLNIVLTMGWLIGITNAINLLDNMDGLAAGITAIASLCLAINSIRNGRYTEALLLVTLCAALLGFLVYNFNPASIFMGDCGSMFIGFYLASVALMSNVGGRSRTVLPIIAVPVLILFIPIFDTMFVAVLRKLSGRQAMKGGKDHTSHRLVALGLPERTAVLLLYALAILAGGFGITARDLDYDVSLALIASFTIGTVILGLYLAGVRVYAPNDSEVAEKRPFVAFLVNVSYKRRVFEVLLDVVLIVLAYYAAYRIRFGPLDDGLDWQRFFDTLPIIIAVKITVFLFAGMYRGLWRYVTIDDVLVFLKAVMASSIACVLILLFTSRFAGLSRTAFVLDAAILFFFILLTRGSFRILRVLVRRARRSEGQNRNRVLIFGAGDGGELLLRELENNPVLRRKPVAFFDDDARKNGKVIHGLSVFGDDLTAVCTREEVDEVIISTAALRAGRLEEIAAVCEELRLPLRQLRVSIVTVETP